MKVGIQVPGTFHAAQLAEQLSRRGQLQYIISSYPYWSFKRRRREVVPRSAYKSVPTILVEKGLGKLPGISPRTGPRVSRYLFDSLARYRIDTPDIFVGWPGHSSHSIQRANEKGIVTVSDADHISFPPSLWGDPEFEQLDPCEDAAADGLVFQKRTLDEEYDRFGIDSQVVDERIVRTELREYRAVDYIVVPTQYVYDTFRAVGFDEGKLRKVPLGVDTDLFSPESKSDDVFRILFVGRISLRKGVQYLLQAVDQLPNDDMELLLVGKVFDNAKDVLAEFEGVYEHVPHVPHEDLPELYRDASVFAFPSVLEGFGMVVSEAMASGLPVITTPHTCGGDLISNGESGFIVPIRDVETLQSKLEYLQGRPEEREAMGRAARRVACEHDWERYGDRMVELYRSMLSGEEAN